MKLGRKENALSREHKFKVLLITSIVIVSLLLISLIVYFFYTDSVTKQKKTASSDLAINTVSTLNNLGNISDYQKTGEGLKAQFDSKTFEAQFGEPTIKQLEKLKNDIGYESSFKAERVEILEKKDNLTIYRIMGTLTEKYTKTNEEHTFPESFIVRVELINNSFVITDYYQEDDVDDI